MTEPYQLQIDNNISLLLHKFLYINKISDGSKLAAGTINGLVSICDLETGSVQFLDGHATPVRSVSFSPDGRLLASASDDKQIKVFDV
ncbi:unnamed protein product [Schistosoma mattheei]|uniref:Uncharacterized protein n=1 Tax=Schistosoma mattheei TaxID=31246 RepID=A0A183NN35_9TREM|nr:unnamed protein product [Schistosoma mattheei]